MSPIFVRALNATVLYMSPLYTSKTPGWDSLQSAECVQLVSPSSSRDARGESETASSAAMCTYGHPRISPRWVCVRSQLEICSGGFKFGLPTGFALRQVMLRGRLRSIHGCETIETSGGADSLRSLLCPSGLVGASDDRSDACRRRPLTGREVKQERSSGCRSGTPTRTHRREARRPDACRSRGTRKSDTRSCRRMERREGNDLSRRYSDPILSQKTSSSSQRITPRYRAASPDCFIACPRCRRIVLPRQQDTPSGIERHRLCGARVFRL